jgi:polo-like kinase 1
MSISKKPSQDSISAETVIEERFPSSDGSIKVKKYSKRKFLGKGGFARVYEFQCQETRRLLASKIIGKDQLIKVRRRQKLMSEIKIHKSLSHQNVVKFEHFFEDEENVYILLELCTNQTLSELLRRRKRLTELEVQCYSLQIISALQYIHSRNIIHRDLKIGNLFLSDKMEVKLGDFGLASKLDFEGQKRKTICGTPNYIAPEVLDSKVGHSFEVDVWALGVIMFTLIVGRPPFETNDVKKTYNLIKMNAYSFPDNIAISQEAKSLITQILKSDPSRRPTLSEITEHEFFHMGNSIPKLLPVSTLAVPPSESYIKKFNPLPCYQPAEAAHDTMPVKSILTSTRRSVSHNTEKPVKCNIGIPSKNSPVWVKKWIDYSTKYGLGYLLSNGSAGVYFNDSTKIVLRPDHSVFYYIERSSSKSDMVFTYDINQVPEKMYKKFALLQHFKSYLEADEDKNANLNNDSGEIHYVKKWLRTKRAILFRFANKNVQVCFQDKTEVIISNEDKTMTYVNKRHERVSMPMNKALESNEPDMAKRVKYTRDILNYMMNGKAQANME